MLEPSLVYDAFTDIPRVFRRAMLREYLQYKTLQYIYRTKTSTGIVLMGGTALRIFYSSGRFSEDLDFDSGEVSRDSLKETAISVADEFRMEDLECTLSFGKGTAFSAKLKFTNILQRWELTGHDDEILMLRFDASPQFYRYRAEMKVLNRLDVITPVPVAPADLLLAQKLYSLINRGRMMGRDIFDASYLFGFAEPDTDYLLEKLQVSSRTEVAGLIMDRLDATGMSRMIEDVEPFLPDRDDLMRVRLFPQILANWADQQ